MSSLGRNCIATEIFSNICNVSTALHFLVRVSRTSFDAFVGLSVNPVLKSLRLANQGRSARVRKREWKNNLITSFNAELNDVFSEVSELQ